MIDLFDRRNFSVPLALILMCVALNVWTNDFNEICAWSVAAIWCALYNRLQNQYTKDLGAGWKRTSRG